MERNRPLTEEQRIGNARKAIENGKRNKRDKVLDDLRTHYREMSRGFGLPVITPDYDLQSKLGDVPPTTVFKYEPK